MDLHQTLLGADGMSRGRTPLDPHCNPHEMRFTRRNLVLFHTSLTINSTTGAAMPSVVHFADEAKIIAPHSCVSGRGTPLSKLSDF